MIASSATAPSTLLAVIGILMNASPTLAQRDLGYFEQKRRLAEIHVPRLVRDWQETADVPGVVVTLVEGDQILLEEAFGTAESATTVFQVGELVRPMTAMALLQQIESGAIASGEDISQHLQLAVLDKRSLLGVTPEALLTHTAGFDERLIGSRARKREDLLPLSAYLSRRMPARIWPPGLISVPSSHGYALAALLVEALSGIPFADYLSKRVFMPLGMKNTTVQGDPHRLGDRADGHRYVSGRWIRTRPDYSQTSPASSLFTTAADMGRWLRALLCAGELHGERVLTPASVHQMLSRQFSNHPLLPGRSMGLLEGDRYSPAELYQATRRNGYSAVVMISPDRNIGLFAAFDGEVDFWNLVHQIFDRLVRIREEPETVFQSAFSKQTHGFSGYWSDASVPHRTVMKLQVLLRQDRIQQTADGKLIWRSRVYRPIAPLAFQQVDGTGRLCFVSSSGELRFAASDDIVLEKLPWFAARPVQAVLWVGFAAIFLGAGWPRVRSLPRHWTLSTRIMQSCRWPLLLARLAATLHFLFLAAVAVISAIAARRGLDLVLYGVPTAALGILVLPMVAAVATLGALSGLVLTWRSPDWYGAQRWRLLMLMTALLAFLPFLHYWNLLGFQL